MLTMLLAMRTWQWQEDGAGCSKSDLLGILQNLELWVSQMMIQNTVNFSFSEFILFLHYLRKILGGGGGVRCLDYFDNFYTYIGAKSLHIPLTNTI